MAGPTAQHPAEHASSGPSPIERLASFRFTYLAIFFFILAYVFTVEGLEELLGIHFRTAIHEAVQVDPAAGPVPKQVGERVRAVLDGSPWIRFGDVQVRPLVLASDGRTLLYAAGWPSPPAPGAADDASLLPAMVDVAVTVPHNAVLANGVMVGYATLLLTSLFLYNRHLTRREQAALGEVQSARDAAAERARRIEGELADVQTRLAEVEPEKEIYAEEIETLSSERSQLLEQLAEVERREAELLQRSDQTRDLDQERRALEELLQEATDDLEAKEEEIVQLRTQVKRAGRGGTKAKESDLLARRLRALYKNLEVDDRAIADLVALGDESLKLRAEEALKRLSDEPENAIVRRKVGGLPPHLSIFELAFAGKGRIYYTKGETRRVRLLAVGAKNTQKADLEYLSRLPRGT